MKKNSIPKHPNKPGSLKSGVLITGILLLLTAQALLYLNENTNARHWQAIAQSGGPVVPLTPGQANPANDGKLVYINGITHISKPLADPHFTPPLKAIALKRQVEIYQWQERYENQAKKTIDGGVVTMSVPTYTKVWSSKIIDSSAFKKQTTHANPRKMRFKSNIIRASEISVGGFKLSAGLSDQLDNYQQISINSKKHLHARLKSQVQLYKDGLFVGNNPHKPKIGDMRVTLYGVRLNEVSIIAKQESNTLKPYVTSTGKRIELLRLGRHNAGDMLPMPKAAPSWLMWSIRLGGFLLIYLGLILIFKAAPASDPTSSGLFFKIISRLAAADPGLSAILIAPALVLLPIAIAWIIPQPLSGGVLLAITLLLAVAAAFALKWLSEPSTLSEPQIALTPKKTETKVPSTVTNAPTQILTASDWLKKGQKMYAEENYKGAIDAFASAIYLDSDLTLAYYNRAITYQKADLPKLAIIDLKSAARLGHKRTQAFLKAKKIAWE